MTMVTEIICVFLKKKTPNIARKNITGSLILDNPGLA